MNKELLYHIAAECVAMVAMVAWFQYQSHSTNKRITELENIIDQQQEQINKLIDVLNNLMLPQPTRQPPSQPTRQTLSQPPTRQPTPQIVNKSTPQPAPQQKSSGVFTLLTPSNISQQSKPIISEIIDEEEEEKEQEQNNENTSNQPSTQINDEDIELDNLLTNELSDLN